MLVYLFGYGKKLNKPQIIPKVKPKIEGITILVNKKTKPTAKKDILAPKKIDLIIFSFLLIIFLIRHYQHEAKYH